MGRSAPSRWSKNFAKPCPTPTSLGPLRADKLIKVRQLNGADDWMLIRIEFQIQCDPKLPHEFWPDDLTLTEDRLQPKLPASKHLTDHFFLMLAVKHRGAFRHVQHRHQRPARSWRARGASPPTDVLTGFQTGKIPWIPERC